MQVGGNANAVSQTEHSKLIRPELKLIKNKTFHDYDPCSRECNYLVLFGQISVVFDVMQYLFLLLSEDVILPPAWLLHKRHQRQV